MTTALIDDGRLRKLTFTGSTGGQGAGQAVLGQAAAHVDGTGGNAPFIVFDDADVDAAVDGAILAKMRNGGEACTAANRFHVANSVRAEFTGETGETDGEFTLGNGLTMARTLAADNAKQVGTVEDLVSDAVARGATVAVGVSRPRVPGTLTRPPCWPTCPRMPASLSEEVFGPVARSPDSTAKRDQGRQRHRYGPASHIYTPVAGPRALRVAESIESGMVGVNRGVISGCRGTVRRHQESGFAARAVSRASRSSTPGHRPDPVNPIRRNFVRGESSSGPRPFVGFGERRGSATRPGDRGHRRVRGAMRP